MEETIHQKVQSLFGYNKIVHFELNGRMVEVWTGTSLGGRLTIDDDLNKVEIDYDAKATSHPVVEYWIEAFIEWACPTLRK